SQRGCSTRSNQPNHYNLLRATWHPIKIGHVPEITGHVRRNTQFGVAHELGHFSLHIGVLTGDQLTETQANRFASALLMPRSTFATECRLALRGSCAIAPTRKKYLADDRWDPRTMQSELRRSWLNRAVR
ncbi:MAG TPA: ImmA/IrrE family metallo-endopeptidase, partial [Rhodoferax sp.]